MFIMPFIIAFTLNILFIALPHSYTYYPPSFPLLIRRLITVVSFPLFRIGIPLLHPVSSRLYRLRYRPAHWLTALARACTDPTSPGMPGTACSKCGSY
jgi:hypothetical protein